jgi:hypothetical protein
MLTHRTNNPQADRIAHKEQCKRHSRENGDKRTAQQNNFECGADKNRGVKKDEPMKVRLGYLSRASRDHLLLMPSRNTQLENAQQANREQKR